jgi:hypothetical protein
MSGIPRAVLEAAERADQILKGEGKTGQQEEEAAPDHESDEVGQDEAWPEAGDDAERHGAGDGQVVEQERVESSADADKWRHKYDVLRGKWDKEIPRMNDEIRYLREELAKSRESVGVLMGRVNEMQAGQRQAQEPQPSRQAQEPDTVRKFRDEYQDIAGPIDQMIESKLSVLKAQNPDNDETTARRVNMTAAQVAELNRKLFIRDMNELCPEWQKINTDPKFIQWLTNIDPLTGQPYQSMLTQASNANDAVRVSNFFNAWKAETGAQGVTQQTQPRQKPLESKVEPSRRGGGPATERGGKKTYTRQEIQQFYRDVQRGAYRGRDEDFMRIDRDIVAAQSEGRIVG